MTIDQPKAGDTIVVWFSCGAASAIALAETIRLYPECNIRAVNNPVIEEDPDNLRFKNDIAKWLDIEIETAINPDYAHCSAEKIWEKGFMSSPHGAPCTKHLKKEARYHWENNNHFDWLVLGFTFDERHRFLNFQATERPNLLGVLVDQQITKEECFYRLAKAGIKRPAIYERGYPNANCIGCVKATSPTYWNLVREQDPEVFNRRAEQSRRIGAKLVRHKGDRIFLDELPPDAVGSPLETYESFECGIFCEEKTFFYQPSLLENSATCAA